ncbi:MULTISPECIES: hypothetical protein [unclassified Mycobacterium]|uniref:hypothetical protein n=1 Tax=unclassified Mycobacterium TaxID=2642494 RepID=UPI0029C75296|nr:MULTISPECIES: hypothetical protein [unclassified Mycobacterium]
MELTEEGRRPTAAIGDRIRPPLAERLDRLDARHIQTVLNGFAILSADPKP